MFYLGLGKTLFNSSACLFQKTAEARPDIELVLSERILRKKASGAWPEAALRHLLPALADTKQLQIAENRDVTAPRNQEDKLDLAFPFYDYLQQNGLAGFSSRFNEQVRFVSHHRCHAMAAVALSPFEKSLIVVMDGAGSKRKDFPGSSPELNGAPPDPESHEECTVYLHDNGTLRPVFKRWRLFHEKDPSHSFSEGVGILYETVAEYIFNSKRAAGKVMGLAAFGRAEAIENRLRFQESLDWNRAFTAGSKQAWEQSGNFSFYANLAASAQAEFEVVFFELLTKLRGEFPEYDRLILTGGCALNCTANGKLLEKALFREIYVPPFPGDECIGFGAASFLYYTHDRNPWRPLAANEQQGYFGPKSSVPEEKSIAQAFAGFDITRPASITQYSADLLSQGKIVAWFQGRSESGPRALGNRSILAAPDVPGLKDRLNREVKFREAFRPYGASCTHEAASDLFEVPKGFNNPYMSFAVRPRTDQRERLKEICHVDGTSRMQTVYAGQNKRFHELLVSFAKKSGLPCLLNTSMNVMGEPIVETVHDAKKFLQSTPVHGIAVGDFYIKRPS